MSKSISENHINSSTYSPEDELVELAVLMEVLGYRDKRTVRKWCEARKVPLIKLGKKTYTPNHCVPKVLTDENSMIITADAVEQNGSEAHRAFVKRLLNKYNDANCTSKI